MRFYAHAKSLHFVGICWTFVSASGRIRTCDRRIRSPGHHGPIEIHRVYEVDLLRHMLSSFAATSTVVTSVVAAP